MAASARRGDDLFFGKGTGRLRSGFGVQPVSRTRTAPNYGFGSAHRDNSKTYVSPEHDRAHCRSAGGNNSQGAIYQVPSALGKQHVSSKTSAPTFRFGTSMRSGLASKNSTPGAGAYKNPSGVGRQVDSTRDTAPRTAFGTSSRDDIAKVFISTDHEKVNFGNDSPGPSVYNIPPGLGRQSTSNRLSSPSWRVGMEGRFNYDFIQRAKGIPGAGQYENTVACGKQVLSRKATLPAPQFGSSTRDSCKKVFISKDHEKCSYGLVSPGPTSAAQRSCVGRQPLAVNKTSSSWSFGTQIRLKKNISDVPGPGTYAA